MSEDFDLVVIGGGSGGVRAARMAAQYGARVAITEEYRYGGTCVIRGCVPKKLFVYASRFSDAFELAKSYGWTVNASFDWNTLRDNKDKDIGRLENAYQNMLDKAGATIFHERATVTGPNSVKLASGKALNTRHILVATGGTPFVPDIPGAELGITSNEAFNLETLPDAILIEGGGYIAVEFAGIFAGLGVDTTIVYRRDRVLRGFDADLREGVEQGMRDRGVKFTYETQIEKLEREGDGLTARFSTGDSARYGAVMFATGRHPTARNMGLEQVGVELSANGAIKVDAYAQSTCPSIHAIGDVTDRIALTPVAIREGAAFAATVFNDTPTTVPYEFTPTAVFSEPEMGTLGLTEAEAREKFRALDVYRTSFRPMINSLSDKPGRMMFKLICESDSGKIVGCHILGKEAGEMIQIAGIPFAMGATKADFDRVIAVHPTASEELVTMKAPAYRIVDGERVDP